ncbi:MAG: GNAT family N-acetyltransferase [Clostridia bacterium]|nr:GNAT family N-acetyltransferase [Clostridia bacterium]
MKGLWRGKDGGEPGADKGYGGTVRIMEMSKCDEKQVCHRPQTDPEKETAAHGTAELRTERLTLRKYRPDDAEPLYSCLGSDPVMSRYSGWNPYSTPETARETVQRFIDSYRDERSYSWAIDSGGALAGVIGAYDYDDGRIEVGFSIVRSRWGQGYATEALKAVLRYLTENEGIGCVTAWCAAENIGSRRVLEKSGMRLVDTEKDGLPVGGRTYDKLNFEYKKK